MGLQPYRQQIGIPREAGGGVSDIVDTRVGDVSGALDNVSEQLMRAAGPRLEQEAINKAQENAGSMMLERNEQGQLVAPERTIEGGIVYQQAFDRVIQARYLTEVGGDFQKFLDDEMAARRQGDKPFDPTDYAQTVDSYKQGMLEGVPGWLRAETEELFTREAQERTRAFTNEVSRTRQINFINGTNDLIKFHMGSLSPEALNLEAKQSNRTVEDVQASHIQAITNLSQAMLDKGFSGDKEAQALFMGLERTSDGIENYYSGAQLLAQNVTSIMSLDESGLNQIELAMTGVDTISEKGITGTVRTSTGVNEVVTPDLITGAYKMLTGKDPTQVARDPNSALGKANPGSYHIQGRAVDSPRIPGMTFEEYVGWWKKQGFDVVEAIDEYKNPSKHSTGGHWHVAFGNSREVIKEETADTKIGLTFEDLSTLDTGLKQGLRQVIADRRQSLREEEAVRRAEALEKDRAAREAANTQRIIDNANGLAAAGAGGDWDAETRGVKDRMFRSAFDPVNFDDEGTRKQIIQWVQRENYLPPTLVQYVTNGVRSDDWPSALALYRSLSESSITRGANVGDLMIEQFDSRTAALLMEADRLERGGQIKQIGPRLERLRSGDGFTTSEAQSAYNGTGKNYAKDRNAQLRETFGYADDVVLDARLVKDFDAAFASNLDIANRDGTKAMQYAARQMQGRVAKSDIFTGGAGPSILTTTYSNQQILDFFVKETRDDTGARLVPPVKGGHRMGRERSTIQLAPLDSETRTIGRYMVIIRNPENLTQVIDSFEIDLGKELREFYTNQGKGAQIDPVAQARDKRSTQQRGLISIGQRADRGPKY